MFFRILTASGREAGGSVRRAFAAAPRCDFFLFLCRRIGRSNNFLLSIFACAMKQICVAWICAGNQGIEGGGHRGYPHEPQHRFRADQHGQQESPQGRPGKCHDNKDWIKSWLFSSPDFMSSGVLSEAVRVLCFLLCAIVASATSLSLAADGQHTSF